MTDPMDAAEFEAVLVAAQHGDEASFAVLFRSVQPSLLRYLRTLAAGLDEDVAADTWVAIVRGLPKFRGDERGWKAWVFTVARAKLVDARRREARTAVPVDSDAALAGVADLVDVPTEVEELMSTEAALALIGRLPPDQAEVVLLRHVAGLDVERTAEVLGKKPGAVRVAAHRGLRRLATLLAPPSDEGVTHSSRATVRE